MLNNSYAQQHIQRTLQKDSKINDVFIFLGDLDVIVVSSAIRLFAVKLTRLGFSKSIITKFKLVTIELLENVCKHQSPTRTLAPYFELSIEKTHIKFVTGNCITKKKYTDLSQTLNKYQTMTELEIKSLYLDKMTSSEMSKSGNAGLGLLTILKRAKKNHEYQFDKISEYEYFFKTSVRVDYSL